MDKLKIQNRLEKLTDLTLDLSGQNISQDDLREILPSILKNKYLKRLKLFRNQITEIPKEIFDLVRLEELFLFENQITEIPKEIAYLKNLQILYLDKNQISLIPKELQLLDRLKALDLRWNKGLEEKVPIEILNDYTRPEKLLNYYFKVVEGETVPINEAKIVVIGESSVGKTSLINRLMDRKLPVTSTHGIKVNQWKDVEINNEYFQLNIWDFGGQEIMHSTHQLFFTHRTIYIIVVNARDNDKSDRAEEWLKRVESLGGGSPVFVVGNKIDENDRNPKSPDIGYFEIDRRILFDKYKNIKGFYGVCSDDSKIKDSIKIQKYNEVFNQFREELLDEINKFEEVRKPFPATWFAVKQKLEEMNENEVPYIRFTDYLTSCIKEEVFDEISQTTIVEFLNDIGTVIYFKDLPETMVFNPEWITKGIYAIIDNPTVIRNKGEFKFEELSAILNQEEYPPDTHKFILDIMNKFELCIDLEFYNKFLVPDLLPLDEIYTGEWAGALNFQFHYETYLRNIITKFIVRTFGSIHQKTYWRNGVVLSLGGCKALVKSDPLEKKITIQIQGDKIEKRRNFLTFIRNEFDRIHSNYTFNKPKEFVAHPILIFIDNDGTKKPILEDYEVLIAMEDAGLDSTFVMELKETRPISEWLDGVLSQEDRAEIRGVSDYEKTKLKQIDHKKLESNRSKQYNIISSSQKKKEISLQQTDIEDLERLIQKYDEEAKRNSNIYSALVGLILSTIILIIIYVAIFNPDMRWLISVFSLILLGISYTVSAILSKDWTLGKFPELILISEKARLYKKFNINVSDLELKKGEVKKLIDELEGSEKDE